MTAAARLQEGHTRFNELLSLLRNPATIIGGQVLLYADHGRQPSDRWRQLRLTDGLMERVRQQAGSSIPAAAHGRQTFRYAHDDLAANHIGVWKKDEIPEVAAWFNARPAINAAAAFDGAEDYVKKIKLNLIKIQASNRKFAYIYRHKGPASLIHKGLMAAFNATSHQFSEISGSVYSLDTSVDFLEWHDYVYIFNLPAFESLTNVREVTRAKSLQAFDHLARRTDITIPAFTDIAAKVAEKPSLSKRMAAAARDGILDRLAPLAMAQRIRQLELPIQIRERNGQYEFVVNPDDAHAVRELVNILSDYYLHSPVTDIEYKAPVKAPR